MNIKEYISSGIIESYILGLATEEEVSILECVRQKNPEVEAAILDAQLLLEELATQHATSPAEHLKSDIWNKIVDSPLEGTYDQIDGQEISVQADVRPIRSKTTQRLSLVAIALLALSIGGNILLYNQGQNKQDQADQANAQNQDSQIKLAESRAQWEMLQRSSVKTVALEGVEKYPGLKAIVFWDTQNAEVLLAANMLPDLPQGKQYQLWAIVDGKPVDAGVLPISSTEALFQMQRVPDAQAFAITMEKVGGSASPTLTAMLVIGNI